MLEFARTRIGQQFFYTFKTVAKALQNIAAKMPESGHLGAAHRLGEAMCRCALCEREAAEALAVGPDAVDAFREENGNWSEFPGYPIENWRYEVENGDTTLGYWEWVKGQRELVDTDYASVVWRVGDVTGMVPDLPDQEAAEWLEDNEKHLRDNLVAHGNTVLAELLEQSGYKVEV